MTKYATRTCNKCGIRKPQNEMIKTTESTGVSASTNFQRKNSTRFYSGRSKTVFYCKDCGKPSSGLGTFFLVVVICCLAFMFFGADV